MRKEYKQSIILFSILFGILFFMFFLRENNSNDIDKALKKAANEINMQCPMIIDSETRMDNVVTLSDKVFQYNYTLINMDFDSINVAGIEEYLRPNLVNNVRTNPDLKVFRDNKVTLAYYYCDRNKVFVTKIIVAPEDYSD